MPKIVFVGGGSAKFVREVTVDLFSHDELKSSHITLMDINWERVERSQRLIQKIIADMKIDATVDATTDRKKALEGADYVIITIMSGGYKAYYADVAIPAKYGVLQAVSDTIGPGGVFRTVRTMPVLEGLVADLKQVAPQAWVLNYANPMAMNIWAIDLCGHERVVGLCHSVQGTIQQIGRWLDVPSDEIIYTAAGINHLNFYQKLEYKGRDLHKELLEASERILAEMPHERTRLELLKYLGHFATEGAKHQTEYYPWFRKTEALVEHYGGETFWGYNVDSANFRDRTVEIEAQIAGEIPISYQRSLEYGASIVSSLESGDRRMFYGNVPNRGLIANLPNQGVVEVPCMVDRNGIFPCRMNSIQPQLAAAIAPHMAVHEMAVQGVLHKDKRLIRQAIQADPLTGAVLTLPRIAEMTDEMFEWNKAYVEGWK